MCLFLPHEFFRVAHDKNGLCRVPIFCRVTIFCHVLIILYLANTDFAVWPRNYTQQMSRHTVNAVFPVVRCVFYEADAACKYRCSFCISVVHLLKSKIHGRFSRTCQGVLFQSLNLENQKSWSLSLSECVISASELWKPGIRVHAMIKSGFESCF